MIILILLKRDLRSERLSNLPQFTQLVSDKVKTGVSLQTLDLSPFF